MIVIMPMAGKGTRFSDVGYKTPKPFIEIQNKPMFIWALKSIKGLNVRKLIVVCLEQHVEHYQPEQILLSHYNGDFAVVQLKEATEGQLCTVLAAEEYINSDEPVLIIASDTLVISSLSANIKRYPDAEGIISVKQQQEGNNWSFVVLDETERVVKVAEKHRISDLISTGLYYFSRGKYLIDYGKQLIAINQRVNNEFYIIPVYQAMISDSKEIRTSTSHQMWDMGNPTAKAIFEQALASKEIG